MTTKHVRLFVSSLLLTAACDGGPDALSGVEDERIDAGASELGIELELATETHIGWTSDGRAAAVRSPDHGALFAHDEGADAVQEALEGWLSRHADELGHASASPGEVLTELELDQRMVIPASSPEGRELVVHRFVQRYRGHRIAGPGATIAVTSVEGAAISVVGALVDARRELEGLDAPSSREAAALAAEASAPGTELVELELVAVPERNQLAWRAKVADPAVQASEVLMLASETGELLSRRETSAHSAFDHAPVRVMAQALTDDPQTTAIAPMGWLPGSTWDGSWNPSTGWLVRMGDDRSVLIDLEQDNSTVTVPKVAQFWWGMGAINSFFTANPGTNPMRFDSQNMFHKLSLALDEIDAEMSSFGWEHEPGSGISVFTPAHLSLVANTDIGGSPDLCQGALGRFNRCTLWGSDIQHPYDNEPVSCIYDCDGKPTTLMHELGHYIDQHNEFGLMGADINSNSCIHDTTDEAAALVETLADIVALDLLRRVYPLDYTLANTATPCTFEALGQGTFKIHDASCLNFKNATLGDFDVDRPSQTNNSQCSTTAARRMPSVNQAIWSWVNRKSCSTSAPYTCWTSLGGQDLLLPGIMYALSLSNAQSYETFFENIETYIWAQNGPLLAANFRTHLESYDIL